MSGRKRGGQLIDLSVRLDRLSMPVPFCGCFIWIGELDDAGYGLMRVGNRILRSHRVSWSVFKGKIPAGKKVLHHCDVRCCVNTDHLFIGTQADNMADMMAKGRGSDNRGEKNSNAKITAEQAVEIRSSSLGCVQLGRKYGIGKSMISNIKRGANWNV